MRKKRVPGDGQTWVDDSLAHFNLNPTGHTRKDLQPVCKKPGM